MATNGTTSSKIRELILSGEFGPGAKLPPERELAAAIGVSRGSVREAISQLSALKIVTARQGAGTFVNPIDAAGLFAPLDQALMVDPGSLLYLFELRCVIEPAASAAAAGRGTAEALEDVEIAWAAYLEAYSREAWSELADLDQSIHIAIALAAANPLFTGILRSVVGASRRSRALTSSLPATHPASRSELSALVDAVIKRDPLRSEAAMMRHLSRLEDDARRALGARSSDHA
jgi:DNA-binding FadR family transcriptional regulator